jgi:hypothetical protein
MRLHVPAGVGAVQLDRWSGEDPFHSAEAELLWTDGLRMRVVAYAEEQMGETTRWRQPGASGPSGVGEVT